MISTRSPMAASAVPRLIAVVVLPTPPFWLAMASTRGGLGRLGVVGQHDDLENRSSAAAGAAAGVADADSGVRWS